ncbi:conjugative transposon protein TraM [Massilibacteroides vaginae]|uniref:conjugative transposon protein TraM n=1 Tax=Massilibacteroides vaginae TaxID=1673718 RepID=UPI000A1CA5FF|nr:conjugative transposon protein TraM [Massilibacteroides vaginae]
MNITNKLKNKKDLLFYVALAIIGGAFLYYIFFLDGKENPSTANSSQLISELPEAYTEELKDKKSAYENSKFEESKNERMKSLQDYMFDLSNPGNTGSVELNDNDPDKSVVLDLKEKLNMTNSRIYDDFDNLAYENERLNNEISRLRKEKNGTSSTGNDKEKIELLKQFIQTQAPKQELPLPEIDEHRNALEVTKPEKEVVTTLADELYLNMPYNAGFITAVGEGYETGKNTIKACIYEEITVMNGERVMLKLLEPLQVGNMIIPKNQLVAGTARIQGDRLDIIISSIEYSGNIIPVHLKVYDTDGVSGVFCPGSAELTAAKEAAANASSGIGSISVARSAGQQIAMDASRAVMQGGSQLLSRKMRTVKVTLKANYQVMLLPLK